MIEGLVDLERALGECLSTDRPAFADRLRSVRKRIQRGLLADRAVRNLALRMDTSVQCVADRRARLPVPAFPAELPVCRNRAEIAAAIADHPVVVVSGETGSGKTTQLPKICLSLGRGACGVIGHTQPRRIAARSVAARIAGELGCERGHGVGYKIRFGDRTSPDDYIKVMTDGMLLAEIQSDRQLSRYDTLILDEAHERSLNIDFLLGFVKQLLPRRPDLKVVVTSATIDTRRFAQHFDGAPVIEVSGRGYPVEVRYRPLEGEDEDQRDVTRVQALLGAVDEAAGAGSGDILVFQSTEGEIRESAEALRKHHPPHTEILPLYARLSAAEQQKVFQPHNHRRIVLATNVAETSLTVPGIHYVVDPGNARISRYSHRSKVQRLPIEKISRASADQRLGRCGRLAPGVCIRLYSADDYDQRPAFTEPELLRTNLASVILQMKSLGLGEPADFPFINPPQAKMISDGYRLLGELQAVDGDKELTAIGRELARMPVDPRIGRIILAARDGHCLTEGLVIAAALSIQDPRERPHEAREAADEAHRRYQDKRSDFLSFFKLWCLIEEESRHRSRSAMRRWCRKHFLSYVRLREWTDLHRQLRQFLSAGSGFRFNQEPADYAAIHRALLTGLLGHIGFRKEPHVFDGARNTRFRIFPGSGLAGAQPKWIVAAELVETNRLYARVCARIEPGWIEQAAGHLMQRSWSEPAWQSGPAQVAAYEKTTLYGLTLNPRRRVNYGPIDPVGARQVFIHAALVNGDYRRPPPFLKHNLALVEEIEGLEHRARRHDILVDLATRFDFYDRRVPKGIYTGTAFERWRKTAEREQPRLLYMERTQLQRDSAEAVSDAQYPDVLELGDLHLPLSYRFEPGHDEDGVSVTIPLPLLNQLNPDPFAWLVPGLLPEKIIALIRQLPKSVRRGLVPVPETARACLAGLSPERGGLLRQLADLLGHRAGMPIAPPVWFETELPEHLRMNFRVVDDAGTELGHGRDLQRLQQSLGARARLAFGGGQADGSTRDGIRTWDFGDLPPRVSLNSGGIQLPGFPALQDRGSSVSIVTLENEDNARRVHAHGLVRLFLLQSAAKTAYVRKHLPAFQRMCLLYVRATTAQPGSASVSNELADDLVLFAGRQVFLSEDEDIRSEAAFLEKARVALSALMNAANRVSVLANATLDATCSLLESIEGERVPREVAGEIHEQLEHMVYRRCFAYTPARWLAHFPRYLEAIRLRLEKLPGNSRRDDRLAAEIRPLWRRYMERGGKPGAPDMEPELELYRWMLEELRVSLFAQELKTSLPVSVKRLEKQWEKVLEST